MISGINSNTHKGNKDDLYNNPLEFSKSGCRGCNRNLASNDPASQYQRQKLIQNTVRVPASLYIDNLGALNVYQKPEPRFGVNWKQMSDRAIPHIQNVYVPSRGSSTRRSVTRNRPGAMSPGGVGVDMKHNSYDRYLARIKGKSPLRRGVIPATFGAPSIPFNQAFPVYGGKTTKTSIVNNCNCPIEERIDADRRIYKSPLQNEIYSVDYTFSVGDFVYAIKNSNKTGPYYKAIILAISNGIYEIKFHDSNEINYKTYGELLIYFKCDNCSSSLIDFIREYSISYLNDNKISPACELLGMLANEEISSDIINYIQSEIRNVSYPNIYS
uniref:Uncharacterized protein n=1 Tax=viral metagenome TaxID=1070528 RepID=A0A6C0F2M2_9ZZZZ